MNPVVFMPRVMPHISSGCGNVTELPAMLLTCVIVGMILYLLGILVNILHIKCSNGFAYTPICWHDIKPGDLDNPILGWICGLFGFAFIGTAVIMGLVAGIYWCIIML